MAVPRRPEHRLVEKTTINKETAKHNKRKEEEQKEKKKRGWE
jgi:hypothetical protein